MSKAVHNLASPPRSPAQLAELAEGLGVSVPYVDDVSALGRPLTVVGRSIPNRMATHPMEGYDADTDGTPGELAFRRYRRFAEGGAGLLWFEACAVLPEGRSNPRQFCIHSANGDAYRRLVDTALRAAESSMGRDHRPFLVLQLTHSGRYSRPDGPPAPIIAQHDPHLAPAHKLSPDYPLITDSDLERIEDAFVVAAEIAFDAGFDAVDIKSCHRYLINELLAAHTRDGKYGGPYENRTRLLKNIVSKIHAQLGNDKTVVCRLGVHDGIPYPHGWGVDAEDATKPDLAEPIRLAGELGEMGVRLINVTMGNPYHNPHVNRPFRRPSRGRPASPEPPLAGVARMLDGARQMQRALPDSIMVGTGVSWLRGLWPGVAAACVQENWMKIIGLGRQAFADPGFAKEILQTGRLDRRHTCVACSGCTDLVREDRPSGCVVLDGDVYSKGDTP